MALDVYVITRVNMADTPAPAISTEAIYKTADMFESDSPKADNLLKRSSYVDDIIGSHPRTSEAIQGSRETENMVAKGGFTEKCWQFSQESGTRTGSELSSKNDKANLPSGPHRTQTTMLKGTDGKLRVLGVGWNPVQHTVVFAVTLNFSKKRKGVNTGPNLDKVDLPQTLPLVLIRRIVFGTSDDDICSPWLCVLTHFAGENLPERDMVSSADQPSTELRAK